MKITESLLQELRLAVSAAGGAAEFARRCGIDGANISRYLSGKVRSVSDSNWEKLEPKLEGRNHGSAPRGIANTAMLRECIKDAMLRRRLGSAGELAAAAGYDSPAMMERLLAGGSSWPPEVLSLILRRLGIDSAAAPLSAAERALLPSFGIEHDKSGQIRPIPVVDWADAAGELAALEGDGAAPVECRDSGNAETVLSLVGGRSGTLAFRVRGVAMEPSLLDNDVILVEPVESMESVPDNKIVVAMLNAASMAGAGVVCKRYHRQPGGGGVFTSDNPTGGVIPFSGDDLAWMGRVVCKITEL